ncbi:eukaryotic translation initiation factor 4E-binding protein 2 isoform X2 [Petaurus breviceps papuanus]|uniref:eukaryotic translation initiation factor 4E-binding protein 2 isoform X2 n=1 Tax=Petaurus breviceps papuanus TaxID=3040969 RepID=UPI0036DD1D65
MAQPLPWKMSSWWSSVFHVPDWRVFASCSLFPINPVSCSHFSWGTRIIYDRKFLLDRRNSPMAQTPPCHLPNIPGVTSPGALIEDSKVEVNNLNNHDGKPTVVLSLKSDPVVEREGVTWGEENGQLQRHCLETDSEGDDAQFEMDI